ncbi:amine oxidase [Lactarius vividus]|nr:amine oxidase [Lactarius vividus]
MALCLLLTSVFALPRPIPAPAVPGVSGAPASGALFTRQASVTQVLILGGGAAGIIATRMLAAQGITNFLIVEARDELGGRMRSATFGAPNRQLTIELGANWVHGTQEGDGPANPMFELALKTQPQNHQKSSTHEHKLRSGRPEAQNSTRKWLPNITPSTTHTHRRQKQSSFIASAWNSNFTYEVDQGGFSEEDLLSIDQRGIKSLIQAEAAEFVKQSQVRLQATVTTIGYSDSGVSVTLTDGTKLTAEYAICTFSLGVLQNDDVQFYPPLPKWKVKAIHSLTMATYTKIFIQFPKKFWFDTEVALYADSERGRYPLWMSLDLDGFMPGSGVIIATVTGDFSKRIEAMTDAQVQSEVMGVLQTMFPKVAIPEPTAFFFPRWFSDPLYRGSYSTWAASFIPQHLINLGASLGRLWFAGEATSERYFGFLHGAYFEGEAAASQIVQCIKGERCYPEYPILYARNTYPYNS